MRKLYLLSALVLTVIFSNSAIYAQDFSNKGKEFWLAYSYHVGMSGGGNPTMTLYLTSDVTTTYNVEIFGVATLQSGTINANQVISIVIPTTYFVNGNGLFNGRAIRVSALKPIVVYSFITRSQASAATLCLPTNVLGKEYVTSSFAQNSNEASSNSFITIVAAEDNTSVEITPTGTTTGGWVANTTYTINLNKGQVYQVLGTVNPLAGGVSTGVDLSGTKIKSVSTGTGGCKKVAVFSGSGKMFIRTPACGNSSSDNLYQQLYPVATWGKKYLTVPSVNKPNNYYRIYRSDPLTNVFLNGVLIPSASFINNYYEFLNTTPNRIEADIPVTVAQYFTTQGCGGNVQPYDPDMIMLSPVEQNISNVTLVNSPLTVTGAHQHNIHVVMKTGGTAQSSFRFDGAPVPVGNWVTHPQDATYSYLYLSNVAAGNHTLVSDSGFNAVAYGYGNAETYGYSAGANVKDLYQQIGVSTQYGIEPTPSVCKGSPFKFKVSLPYCADSIRWDLTQLPGPPVPGTILSQYSTCTAGAGGPDSTTVVNGVTLYWYSLPTLYNFNTSGTFPVTMTVYKPNTDGCGNEQEINFDLNVFDPPVADFNWTAVGCVTEPVQFQDITTTPRPSYIWNWNFGDPASGPGNTSGLQNPTHLFSAPGTYTVTFSTITTPGCISAQITKEITVAPLPTATITGNATVCINASSPQITFIATGGTAPYTFTYNINGGPPQTISTTGSNTSVTLSVPTNVAGVFRYNLEEVRNTGSTLCFTPYNNTYVEVIVTANTTLQLTSGSNNQSLCQDIAITDIVYTIGGGGNNATVTGLPTGVTGNYNAGIFTISGIPTTPGTYNYSVTATGDCLPSSASGTITVNPDASISLTSAPNSDNQELCRNSTLVPITYIIGGGGTGAGITGLPAGVTGTFSGGIFTISGNPTADGTFIYTVTTTGTCLQKTVTGTIIVNPLPTASFNVATPTCETRDISFNDNSVPNVGGLTNWLWNFGDPASGPLNTSTLQNPTHIFAAAGSYNVTLSVTNSKGCISSPIFTRTVVINSRPLAGFIVPEVCLSDTYAQFTDTSSVDAPDFIQSWNWNFGDPGSGPLNTSTLQNPQHSYTATGSYNVQLIATSNNGCRDTVTQVLFINGSFPAADFTLQNPTTLCANDSVAIVEASTVFPGTITKVEIYWDNVNQPAVFDTDNSPFTGKVYKHLYPNFQAPLTRTFTIRYRAYSGGVCVNDKLQNITVNAAPLVQFNAVPDVCFDAAAFSLSPYVSFGAVPGTGTYSGPGVTTGGIFTPSLVAPGGTYTIQYLHTSTAAGCRDSATQTITVIDTASARFVVSNLACERSAVSFNSTSSTIPPAAGTITGWQWNFGDPASGAANTSTLQNPSHLFTGWGTYNVSLVVTTSNNCRSTAFNMPVVVNPIPRPNFSFPASSCLPSANVQFTNLSTIPDGSQASFSYLWNFGDPGSGPLNTSTGSAPSHIYNAVGPYSVNLQVTSGVGCARDTTIVLNTIHPQPTGSFNVDKPDLCVGESFQFTDNSNPADGTTTQWNWAMGDGNVRTTPSFTYTYGSAGTYDVSLYITNSFGCRSTTFTQQVTVNPYPVVDAGPDLFILEDGSDTLQPIVTAINPSFLWTPNQYFLSSNTIERPIVKGVEDIWYTLTVTGRGGCVSSDRVFIKVLKGPEIPNIFSPNGDGIHDRWEIKYLDTYPGGTVEIFNRYGQKIFSSVGYGKPWDGTVNGKPVPVGTYYYIVNPKNGRSIMTGYVDVIR